LKIRPVSWWDAIKHRLVLTPEEKRIIIFILVAFFLGLATNHYRSAHLPAPLKIDKKTRFSRTNQSSPSPTTSPR
jgi:hypothetical protein